MFIILLLAFILYTIFVVNCPMILSLDRLMIKFVQNHLSFIPSWFPGLFDCFLYAGMILIPLVLMGIYFLKKKKYFDILFLSIVPLATYGFGTILKHIVQRPRPPVEFFINVNPDGFSYVSNHTLISFVFLLVMFYLLNKIFSHKITKMFILIFIIFWVILIGFSRVWLGVHNPTDVIGAYFFGTILVIIFIKVRTFFEKYIGL